MCSPNKRWLCGNPRCISTQAIADQYSGNRKTGDPQLCAVSMPLARYCQLGHRGSDGIRSSKGRNKQPCRVEQQQRSTNTTACRSYLGPDRNEYCYATHRRGGESDLHDPTIMPDFILADHAPRRFKFRCPARQLCHHLRICRKLLSCMLEFFQLALQSFLQNTGPTPGLA